MPILERLAGLLSDPPHELASVHWIREHLLQASATRGSRRLGEHLEEYPFGAAEHARQEDGPG